MDSYSTHFLIALLVADVLLFFTTKGKPRLVGLFAVPVISYILFYDQNLSLLAGKSLLLTGYVGSCFVALFYSYVVLNAPQHNSLNEVSNYKKQILLAVLQLFLVFLLRIVPWAINTFPLADANAVTFTLLAPIEGSNDFVMQTLLRQVFVDGMLFFLLLAVAQCVEAKFSITKFSKILLGNKFASKLYRLQKIVVLFLLGCVFAYLFVIPSIASSDAFRALIGINLNITFEEESVDSPFYREYYKNPQNAFLPDSIKKKNLVVVFLESMANNYQKYTPELNNWKRQGISFEPGGECVAGTSWTIAGITSALCGLPLNIPLVKSELKGELPTYLPGAICLMDLLKGQGYNQSFFQGSNADFSQKRQFWRVHGDVDIVDEPALKMRGEIPKNYNVFWGVEDKKMLSFAKEELSFIAKSEKPFAAYLLTVDTHLPEGFLDTSCHNNESTTFQNVLRCSSSMVGDFLDWISVQSWFENTIVMVVGDHTMPTLSLKAGLSADEKLYTTAFFLNVNKDGVALNRRFSNMDYAPTILEAMGWELENHAFGLGRSLIANDTTLLEILGKNRLDSAIKQRSIQYDDFLFGSKPID